MPMRLKKSTSVNSGERADRGGRRPWPLHPLLHLEEEPLSKSRGAQVQNSKRGGQGVRLQKGEVSQSPTFHSPSPCVSGEKGGDDLHSVHPTACWLLQAGNLRKPGPENNGEDQPSSRGNIYVGGKTQDDHSDQ